MYASEYFEICPPENVSVPDNYPWIHPPAPNLGSILILVGSSGCGKINVVKNLLDRYWIDPNSGKSVFDIILLMSPPIEQDPIYEQLFSNPILHDVILPNRDIDTDLIRKILDRPQYDIKICVFIDDFAFDKHVFTLPEVKALFFRGRHAGITPTICSQFFFAIDPIIRVNATGFMIFRLTRANETPHFVFNYQLRD